MDLTSTGYGPSKVAASRLGASLSGPDSPGLAVTTVLGAATGGGGECGRGLGGRGPPASRSSSRAMVGDAAVSKETAWSCLASVMSTPLICKRGASQGALWGAERTGRYTGPAPPTHREDTVADLQSARPVGSAPLCDA